MADAVQTPTSRRVKKLSATTATAAKRMLESDPELMQWQNLLIAISTSKNWIDKKEAISKLTELVIKHCLILRDVGKLETCLDGLLERLADGSIKVNLSVSVDLVVNCG